MLKLDIRVGESFAIGDGIVLSLEKKSGQLARIAIRADPSLKITKLREASAACEPKPTLY